MVEAACQALARDLAVHHTLHELARRVGSNRNSLARAFKKVLGKGPYAWLSERRMVEAATQLKTTDRPVQQISFDVGYSEPANFSTAFKRVHGLSPRRFREKMRDS